MQLKTYLLGLAATIAPFTSAMPEQLFDKRQTGCIADAANCGAAVSACQATNFVNYATCNQAAVAAAGAALAGNTTPLGVAQALSILSAAFATCNNNGLNAFIQCVGLRT